MNQFKTPENKHKNNCKSALYKDFSVEKLIKLIDWSYFFNQWSLRGRFPELMEHPEKGESAKKLYTDALQMVEKMDVAINGAYKTFPARQLNDDIILQLCQCCNAEVRLPMLRNQTTHFKSLSDFVTPKFNQITLYALCVHNNGVYENDYDKIMSDILCNRLAAAFQSYLINEVTNLLHTKTLAFDFGYPATPDHSPKKIVLELLNAPKELNMSFTENYAMFPLSSCCGVLVSHENIEYFAIGYLGEDQIQDYARRTGLKVDELKALIPNNLLPL